MERTQSAVPKSAWMIGGSAIVILVLWFILGSSVPSVIGLNAGLGQTLDRQNAVSSLAAEGQTTATDVSLARAEAQAKLRAVESALAQTADYQSAAAAVQNIRTDIALTHRNAEADLETQWRQIDLELAAVAQSLRSESATARDMLNVVISLLDAPVRLEDD